MTLHDLEKALQDAFDGNLDESRAQALREAMKQSPGILDAYCDQALLETELRRHFAGRVRIPGAIPAGTRFVEHIGQRKRVMISLFSAAAVLLLAGIVLRLVWINASRPLARLETSPGTVLRHDDGTPFVDSTLKRDQSITLDQGVMHLSLKSGVDGVIEGPASLKLTAENELTLTSGHAWFHVPAKARGFRVVSPALEVTDLGTEFGIDQREGLRPQVHVLKGVAETRARSGNRRTLTLLAGHAAELAANGRWTTIPVKTDKFRNHLPSALPTLRLDFDHLENGTLALDGDLIGMAGGSARLIHPELASLVPGVSGMALQLNGDGASIETHWPGISGTAPRTVSVWCRVPIGVRQKLAPPLVWWGDPAVGRNRKFKVALVTRPNGSTVLRVSFGNTYFNGAQNLADGDWHHLAVVYSGNRSDASPRVQCFIDGAPEPVTIAGANSSGPCSTGFQSGMGIGKYELKDAFGPAFLHASLDDLRIFAGSLTPDEIRALATPQ